MTANITPGSIEHYYKTTEATRQFIEDSPDFSAKEKQDIIAITYGHMADGDISVNIAFPGYENHDLKDRLDKKLYPFMMDFIKQTKGSVGAEIGIGQMTKQYLPYSKSEESISVMKTIKSGMDPNGIMNPYKMLT